MIKLAIALMLVLSTTALAETGLLFVGLEGSAPPTKTSNLSGFPNVPWVPRFAFDVSGAAATPEGELYVCNGPFTTQLYRATLDAPPVHVATISVDISALAYGRGTLWGYSNYASPRGIYAIDIATGHATLALDVATGTDFRFFGLDYNPADDLFYGYTEYGDAGLYSIDIDTGQMLKIAGTIPAANSQGRGLAVGENTVYLTATRGDDGIPYYAYDLLQGPNGAWVGFTNAYPADHATGGAAWIPEPTAVGDAGGPAAAGARLAAYPNPFNPRTQIRLELEQAGRIDLAVYSILGRRIATLFAGEVAAGRRDFTWDGRDEAGNEAASGVYEVRMSMASRQEGVKLVMLR